jgi:hypothetical protein
MIFKLKFPLFSLLFLALAATSEAQPTLPRIGASTKDGVNILSWINPYSDGIKSIAIQRSNDSTYNFSTIGYIPKIEEGVESFVDGHPLPGVNWYRLQIIFSSDIEWKSDLARLVVDSSAIASRKPLPANDSLQKLISKMGSSSPVTDVNAATYPKSKYVFTNPFTGNINIEIPDAFKNIYSLEFYNEKEKEVLAIPRIDDSVVILDKRNFQSSGVFKFRLFKNKQQFEEGYVTIY